MNSGNSIELQINELINGIIGQKSADPKKLSKNPLCLFVGEIDENIKDNFKNEIDKRFGSREAIEIKEVFIPNQISEVLEEAINSFRVKKSKGVVNILDEFYVSLLFMWNNVNQNILSDAIEKIEKQFYRLGFGGKYQISLYCFIDYENCNEKLRNDYEKIFLSQKYSVCLFSQEPWEAKGYYQYHKSIQTAVTDIFLNVSEEYTGKINLVNRIGKCKTLGYWKLDILKVEIINQILEKLKSFNSKDTSKDYENFINEKLENYIKKNDKQFWDSLSMQFKKHPLDYIYLSELLKNPIFSLTKKENITFEQLILNFYGKRNVFPEFLKKNINLNTEKMVKEFIYSDLGNLYDVNHKLSETLEIIISQMRRKIEQESQNIEINEKIFVALKRKNVDDLTNAIFEHIFSRELENFQNKLILEIAKKSAEYLKNEEFVVIQKNIMERYQKNIDILNNIKREIFLYEEKVININENNTTIINPLDIKMPLWYESIMDTNCLVVNDDYFKKINFDMNKKNQIFNEFIIALEKCRAGGTNLFYTLQVDNPIETSECQILFMNNEFFPDNTNYNSIENVIRQKLPSVNLLPCTWIDEKSMELIAYKEIESLNQIYGFNRGEIND